MSEVTRRALRAPALVAAATLVVAIAGGAWLALVTLAVGAAVIIAFHVWHLRELDAWTRSRGDVEVPEGRGAWAPVLASLYRQMRARDAYERNLGAVVERFRQAASAIPDGIVALDAANRIDWANARALSQFGLDLAKDRMQPIVNLVRQPDFRRYLQSADWTSSIVVPSEREPGRTLALSVVEFATDRKLLIARDITESEAVARMRRDFIASVSHELKTPLTVVSGFIEALQESDVDAGKRAHFLALMRAQAKSMQRLVADLLTLSALESDQNPVHEERFAVAPLLTALARDARALSADAHEIVVDVAEPATIRGSRDEIASALGNLLSNAVRYTRAGGTIRIAWRIDEEGRGIFAVSDTGIGIAPEHLPRLTERFYRVDRSRSRATGGTGLGLAIVKHVVLRHEAELTIESELGKGSVFSVRLPASRVMRTAEATRTEAPAG